MKQLKLILTVKDSEGNVKFHKDPAVPQDFMAALNLFTEAGTVVSSEVVELDINISNN